jgi:predicted amidophosphoribosyltransferase
LARRLAQALDLPAQPDGLQRWRDTPAQSTLDAAARRANLRDAFLIHPGWRSSWRAAMWPWWTM